MCFLQCKLIDEGVIWRLKAFLEFLCAEGWRLGEQQVHTTHPLQNGEGGNISLEGILLTTFWALLLLLPLLSYSRTPHRQDPSPL